MDVIIKCDVCVSLFSFLLEFNLYSWWNVDLSVKGNYS